jgi:membrane-associated phospholipid phosphatase
MNLGVHYPTDVLAGALLGTGTAFLTFKVNEWLNRQVRKSKK